MARISLTSLSVGGALPRAFKALSSTSQPSGQRQSERSPYDLQHEAKVLSLLLIWPAGHWLPPGLPPASRQQLKVAATLTPSEERHWQASVEEKRAAAMAMMEVENFILTCEIVDTDKCLLWNIESDVDGSVGFC